MWNVARVAAIEVVVLFIAGCASTQLNYNTEELAGTVDKLIKDQIVQNLGRFLDDPETIPTQVAIHSGSVTTTNQVSASWTDPLNRALTATTQFVTSASPSVTKIGTSVLSSSTITPGLNNQASQNWALSPISDADQVRRLRALYRYVTTAPGADLCGEYPLLLTSFPTSGQGATVQAPMEEDEVAWKMTTSADLDAVYRKYLQKFRAGKHRQAAVWRLEQIKKVGDVVYDGEEAEWRTAIKGDSIESYQVFLTEHNAPADEYVQGARQRLSTFATVAIGGMQKAVPSVNLSKVVIDANFMQEPSCVICSRAANASNISAKSSHFLPKTRACRNPADPKDATPDLYINPRLKTGWLYPSLDSDTSARPPTFTFIGTFRGYPLYSSDGEAFNQFVIFILEGTSSGSSTGSSGKSGASGNKAILNVPAGPVPPI